VREQRGHLEDDADAAPLRVYPRAIPGHLNSADEDPARVGHLERQLSEPIATVIDADARTVPPDATVEELFWQHLVGTRQRSVPVVDGARYVGLVAADDLAALERAAWATTPVADVLRPDRPVAGPDWTVAQALRAMDRADMDRLAVVDGDRYVGVVTADDVVRLDEILERTGG